MTSRELSYSYPPQWAVLNRGHEYRPFDWQVQHLHSQVDRGIKTIILPCGRRSGKSVGVVAEVARAVARPPVAVHGMTHAPIIYVIGPTAETSMRVFQPIWNAFVPPDKGDWEPPLGFLYHTHDKNRGLIELKNGAAIFRKTADDPRSLQGERVTDAFPDEAHDINEDAWENLLPALSDSDGRMVAIGVAKGRGRFRSLYHAGQGMNDAIYSASVPTTANPIFVERAREAGLDPIEYIRRQPWASELTDAEFERQYLAKWTDEDGQVFANFERCFTGLGISGPGPNIMSLDLGKLHDFTVAYVGDMKRQEFIARLRFNKIDYIDQVPRIADFYHQYKCRFIHMDTNGPGEAPAEMLRAAGCSIIPFKWTNESKQALVSVMVRETQRGNITFLADDEPLKKEMGLFEGTISPGGVVKYEAPKGFYDDCVIAAALLIQKMARNKGMTTNPIYKPYATFTHSSHGLGPRHIRKIECKPCLARWNRDESMPDRDCPECHGRGWVRRREAVPA